MIKNKKLISILVLGLFLLSTAGVAFSKEIITFGYTQDRQRTTESEKMFPPIDTGWYPVYDWNNDGVMEEVGETRSQPLILNGDKFGRENPVVVFMAKNHANNKTYLYGFEAVNDDDLVKGFAVANDNIVFPPLELDEGIKISRSSTTYFTEDGIFASGTAEGSIKVHYYVNGEMKLLTGQQAGTDIVSAPMITNWNEIPVVIFGGNDGYVHLLTNLHLTTTEETLPLKRMRLGMGGVVSSSPAPIYDGSKMDGFVIGRDDSSGVVKGYFFADLFDLGEVEGMPTLTPKANAKETWKKTGTFSGIPSSFTTESNYTYFSDKAGRLTKVNNKTGNIIWTDTHNLGAFINNSPALDDKFVYYPMKTIPGHNFGGVAILEKVSAKPIKTFAANNTRLTTSPVVWHEANVVIFGTEDGSLVGFWRDIVAQEGRSPDEALALNLPAFSGNNSHLQYPSPRVAISGLTSEISIAQNLLIIGGQMPIPEGGGVLVYQLADTAPDWFVKEFKAGLLPEGATTAEIGGEYVATVKFGANGLTGDKPISVQAKVNGEQVELYDVEKEKWVGAKPGNIIIYPGEEKEYTFAWQTPVTNSNIKLEVEINPDRTHFEKDYKNNYYTEEIPVDKTDIEVIVIDQTSPVKTDSIQTAKVTFGNPGTKNTDFVARYYADGALIASENVTLASGGVMQKTFSWIAPSTAKTVQLKAVAEAANDAVPENNVKTTNVTVKLPNYSIPDCQFGQSANKTWPETYALIVGYGTKTVCETDCWESCSSDDEGNESCSTSCSTTCWEETDYSKKIWDTETVYYNENLSAITTIDTKQNIIDGGPESRGAWEIVPYAQSKGLDPKMVTRAGYGFEVKVKTTYNNDWETKVPSGLEDTAYPKGGQFQGPTKVEAEFYDTNGAFVEAIELVPTSGAKGDWNITWELPIKTHIFHDGTQATERKHYVPLNAPDGNYTVRLIIYNAGKHDLSVCQDKTVTIYGSMYDDVYYRTEE